MSFVISPEVVDQGQRGRAVAHVRELGITLPTFSELASPVGPPAAIAKELATIAPDEPRAENLWRMHWYNAQDRKQKVPAPGFIVLTEEITGVKAPILVLLGRRFPMISAHKVLPAYSGLITQLVTGRFDPAQQKAVWPSTGNYCRGGVSVSRILGCRGVAVLPAGMSRERFEWLEKWVVSPEDIVRTPGTESNVKEIYDKCAELSRDPQNVILNQFSAFSNYLVHYACTGLAAEQAFEAYRAERGLRLAAFVSATGSAGTIAAGDYLKQRCGSKIAAVEALECPTMLENGFGEHNIQGIGDKHIPLIHNVMNTDVVIAVSDQVSDRLNLLFGSEVGQRFLRTRHNLDEAFIAGFSDVGISGFANIAASIKLAKHFQLGSDDVIVTVATDCASLYDSERENYRAKHYPNGFDDINAGEIFSSCLSSLATDNVLELTDAERRRIFNLGYYTWVEQQGVSVEDFESRRDQSFWREIADSLPAWDKLISDFNREVRSHNR